MARGVANIGVYVSPTSSKISLEDALQDIAKAQCLYIRNIKDNKVLFISPKQCRLMDKKTFDSIVSNNEIVNINYTTLYAGYGKKTSYKSRDICPACYWGTEYPPYIALIKIFYNQALGVTVINDYTNNGVTTKDSTYEQYSKLMIEKSDKNLLQEFFINKEMTAPAQGSGGWYRQWEDTYFSDVESDYSDVEFGTFFSLASFKFHKKADMVTYELIKDLAPVSSGNGSYYYRTDFGGYMPYSNNILDSSTAGLFNILSEEFEDRFPDFAAKVKLNDKLFAKYTSLRAALMNRENRNKAFLFSVSYQNRHSLCITEIYDFDLIKKTFDYTNGDDFGDELLKISKVIADNNFIKLKARYGSGAVYLNKGAFTDEGANIEISMDSTSYGVNLNFKNGRHKCSIPVTSDILNELEGSIPEEQLMLLKCELVLRQ